ncbi:BMP family ABC transporter substrate-binding protein [Haliangium ochraceum]|uniref:Basic membrane lipoprotein n=1 Tax=Haliangium ochraceum (strain DSM 14365 / JCM 11303 / SMP-2) TaxID=502025 RepID=D0LI13_HALO1|nr:BMP family ABC transporter substrate-binding protein [Haliangium ochraceum]ACY14842.1 basic membrane lipoprotein [Haliangium ochraceum DSM 14365]
MSRTLPRQCSWVAPLAALCLLTACPPSKTEKEKQAEDPAATKAKVEGEPAPTDKLQVAFVYVGPVGDAGWTFAHDQARQDLEARYPWVETSFVESVPEGPEAERVLTQLVEKGADLVFTTSFGFMDPTIAVAKRYPDTVFMHCSGYKRADNVGTYFGRMYQPKYLAGLVAGAASKSGKVGFVAPHPIPEVVRHINAFTIGVREVNPEAEVHVVWTNTWFDVAKEKQAADALMDAGADVIATGADSVAPLQAAEARGKLAIGYDSDSRAFAPKAFLTAPLFDWRVVYRSVVEEVREGSWSSGDFWGGLDSGVVLLAPLSDLVPEDARAKVEARQKEIEAGAFTVFRGPLKRQDGSEAVAAEATLSDKDLLSMRWFVDGVVGKIPE